MELQVSESVIDAVAPFLYVHNAIGLFVVAVFMFLRSDSVLKLFGVGIALIGLGAFSSAVLNWFEPSGALQTVFAVIGGLVSVVGVVVFVVVGSSDYSRRWRRIALIAVIVWAVVLSVLGPLLGTSDPQQEGGLYDVGITLTSVWFLVVWFVAYLEAAHIAVEHSHGEPYRSILLAALSVFAVAIVVGVVAEENDQLNFLSASLATAMVFVMWVAVVLHERKEIAEEHRVDAEQPA